MKVLKNSGLPIYMDVANGQLELREPLTFMGFTEKKLCKMKDLYYDSMNADDDEIIYDFYRGILCEGDKDHFERDQYRYSITVIKPGMIGREFKKTSGHYHSWNEMHTSTIPEVYEVINGTAIYVLQRADNFDTDDCEQLEVSDIIIARVQKGQSIIIPPNYGHCSINVSDEPLVFSNLAYISCKVIYEPVSYYHGMGIYVEKQGSRLNFVKNSNYKKLPSPRYVEVKENKKLGIEFGKPLYNSYMENPAAYDFLKNPDLYKNQIMDMLEERKEGFR